MKKIENLATTTQDQILSIADDLNFYGKRKKDTRLIAADQILATLKLKGEIESIEVVNWLKDRKPTKAASVNCKGDQRFEPTFIGQGDRDTEIEVMSGDRFVIVAAQNNTLPHKSFYNLIDYAKRHDAKLIVMPIKYTTTLESLERKKPTYHKDIAPYLLDQNVWLGWQGGVRLAVTANILPSAVKPINAAMKLNNGESITVVASPRAQIKPLPRPKNGGVHRWAYTSRVITERHYTDSRIGDESSNDHYFGGVFIEIDHDNKTISHHEIDCDESGDITREQYDRVAVVLGDLHCEKMCPHSLHRALDLIDYVPVIAVHDSLDHMSRNHHNIGSGRFLYQMGTRTVINDLTDTINILNRIAKKCDQLFMVRSNHDLALDQWLDSNHYNPNQDPLNAKIYHFLKYLILETIDDGADSINAFKIAAENVEDLPEIASNIIYGDLDESFTVCGVELGQHGHNGTGGARGSLASFKRMGNPTVTGHTHTPERDGNNLVVGVTGSLDMGYNKGGSTWDRANVDVFESGRSELVPYYSVGEAQY